MKISDTIFPLLFTLLKNYFLLGKRLKLKPIVESLIQTSHEFAVNSADIKNLTHTMRGLSNFLKVYGTAAGLTLFLNKLQLNPGFEAS